MRDIDRIALEETGPNLYQMMENAGRSLAVLAIEILGSTWRKGNVLVLSGGGGNGGGGICAGRHLANRGVNVSLCLARPEHLEGVPLFQKQIFEFAGGTELDFGELHSMGFDLIIDALIGYGLHTEPKGMAEDLINWANETEVPVLALDVPSGVDASSGETPGVFMQPDATMTLALPKTGLRSERTGDLYLADIGIPTVTFERAGISYQVPFEQDDLIRINAMGEKKS